MKKKRTKRTNSQSEVESEQEKSTTNKKIKQSPIKFESLSKGFEIIKLQKISQEVHTVALNELQSPKTVTKQKRLSEMFESNTKSIEPSHPEYLCIPLIPATFFDWIHYESKCLEIRQFLEDGIKKQDIIPWIQDNNRLNHGIQNNCQLLSQIQSQQFWNVIIHQMLNDVLRFSFSLDQEKVKFLTSQKYGSNKLQIGRGYCYLLLIQWFFGLIPPQYHLSEQNAQCTFALYMYRQQGKQGENRNKKRLISLKAIINYLSLMTIQQNHAFLSKQQIIFQINSFKMKQNFFLNPQDQDNEQKTSVLCDYEEDFGQIGDEVFSQVSLKMQEIHRQENKFNQGESLKQTNKVYAFFQIEGSVFDERKIQHKKSQFELNIFLLQYPQTYITKLLFPGFSHKDIVLSVRGLRKWSTCMYTKDKTLQGIRRFNIPNSSKSPKNFTRLVLKKQENHQQISIKDYIYDSLKIKIQNYINVIKASIKGFKQKQIIIPFDSMKHKDIYLNFLLIWSAVSLSQRSKCYFFFELSQLQKSTKYNLSKFHKYFSKKDIAQFFSVLKGYQLFMDEKKHFFSSPKDLSFLDYVKRHVF